MEAAKRARIDELVCEQIKAWSVLKQRLSENDLCLVGLYGVAVREEERLRAGVRQSQPATVSS